MRVDGGEKWTCPSSTKVKLRRARNLEMSESASMDTDPTQNRSSGSKSSISSLLYGTNKSTPKKKLNNFTQSTFRGLGCTAASSRQVSLPAVIRTSADWDAHNHNKVKNKKKQKNNNISSYNKSADCVVIQDVWCGPGIGFSSDAVVGSVDCVVARRNGSGRGKIDGEKLNQRERDRESSSCLLRRTASSSFPDSDTAFGLARPKLDVFGPRHFRHPSPDGLTEIMMLQNSLMMGGRLDSRDHFRDWRLDVDNMSYEELLELGERIGYVSTGLKEDEIGQCLRKLKNSIVSSHISIHGDKKCSICQEDYEADDEMGKLDCGHKFHMECIKQWLAHKNTCPVCKAAVVAR